MRRLLTGCALASLLTASAWADDERGKVKKSVSPPPVVTPPGEPVPPAPRKTEAKRKQKAPKKQPKVKHTGDGK